MSRMLIGVSFVFALAACGQADLDRSHAEELLNESEKMIAPVKSLRFAEGGYDQGVEQGKWTVKGDLRIDANLGIDKVSKQSITLGAPASRRVTSVTGIAELAESGSGAKLVEFEWQYAEIPNLARRYVRAGGSGSALARLYDDGWRVSQVNLKTASDPFTLSSAEISQRDTDVEEELRYRRAEAERIQRENEQREREKKERELARASKISECTLDSLAGVYGSQYGDLDCSVSGESVTCCYSANCKKRIELTRSDDLQSLTGMWIERNRGPAIFPISENCEIVDGLWGQGTLTPRSNWKISGRK